MAFLLAVACAGPAVATQLFHSPGDDGAAGSTVAPGAGQSVFLYIDGGATATQSGAACHDGDGDEVCGFTLELTAISAMSFSAFVPDAGADLIFDLDAGTLRVNGLDPVAPGSGPQRIGALTVTGSVGGSIELTSGEAIGADLGSETLTPGTVVTVPEPAMLAMLGSGALLLAGLARRRTHR